MKKVAFFDFDGTLTTKDTLLEFIKFSKGTPLFYLGFALNSPWLIAYRCKLISNQTAKEKILRFFYRNLPLESFQQKCDDFAATVIPHLLRKKGLEEINTLQQAGFEIVIVSASPGNWIKGWADTLNLQLIATQLQTNHNTPSNPLTGKIKGKNCHGQEKVRRIKESFDLSEYNQILCYGDTSGDRPMLALGTTQFYQPFR